ncbi:MAG: DUF4339 domain-containing protein [Synergistaceae bacterium]|nr:DUF4339 domain-containing protein [Synergistaceae bacterium]
MRSWYCASNGSPSGPFSDEEMRELIKCKMVRRNTLVWHNVPGEVERGWVVAAGTDLFAKRRGTNPLLTLERGVGALWRGFCALCRKILMVLGVGLGMILILLFGAVAVISTSEDYRVPVILLVILLIFCFVVLLHLHLKRQLDIDILNSNISKMSDDEAKWLAEKYQDK